MRLFTGSIERSRAIDTEMTRTNPYESGSWRPPRVLCRPRETANFIVEYITRLFSTNDRPIQYRHRETSGRSPLIGEHLDTLGFTVRRRKIRQRGRHSRLSLLCHRPDTSLTTESIHRLARNYFSSGMHWSERREIIRTLCSLVEYPRRACWIRSPDRLTHN